MKGWRFAVSLVFWVVLVSIGGVVAQGAGFSPSISLKEGRPGDVVEITIPYDGALGDVAAFRVNVEYDTKGLEYLRPQYGESIREGAVTTVEKPGLVSTVYTAKGESLLAAGDSVTYRFRVGEDALPGQYSIFVSVFEIASPDPTPLGNDVDISFTFQVLEPLSSDARLLSLFPSDGELEPAFDPSLLTYRMTVPYEVESITFLAEAAPGAICRVNRKNLGSGGSDTPFTITVTAEDGETKQVYTVTVHREEKEEEEEPEQSADARLLSLKPASGTLTPAFDPEHLEYTLTVPFTVTTMTFTAEPVEGATYRVNRKNLGAGGSDTPFTITVTAEDGETKRIYTVTVHREEKEEEEEPEQSTDARLLTLEPATGTLTPAFEPERLEYTLTVPFTVTTMTFTAEPVEGATYRVNRKNLGAGGSDTPFTITVTAEDGETKQVYTVTVHRQEKVTAAGTASTTKPTSSGSSNDSSPRPSSTPAGEDTAGDVESLSSPQGDSPNQGQEPDEAVLAAVDSGSGGGSGTPQGQSAAGGIVFQNGDASLVPGLLALLAFMLLCFLSGPLAKALARCFPGKDQEENHVSKG